MQLNQKKVSKINQFLGKTYKTNKKKCHYRSVFDLKICKKILDFYRCFGLFLVFFMLQYAMDVKRKMISKNKCNKFQNW